MVSGRRTPVCKLTGQPVLLFRGAQGSLVPPRYFRRVRTLYAVARQATSGQQKLVCQGEVAEWQTRTVQVRVPERAWGFNSPLPHR